jgi:hypothetical protein
MKGIIKSVWVNTALCISYSKWDETRSYFIIIAFKLCMEYDIREA